jgi:hypothetical protein
VKQWSYSRLQTYAQCPMQFRLKYVEGQKGTTSPAALRGSQVHEFCELYARHCHAAGVETDWSAGRELLASYPDEVRTIGETFIETTQFDWNLTVADGESVEREFEVALPGDLGTLRGRCDLVLWNEYDGALIVTDYKSGWSPRVKPDFCPPQLELYAWAMQQTFDEVNTVVGIYRYLGNNRSYEWTLWEPTPNWATSLVRRIEADDDYRATPGAACEWCDFTHCCPLVLADPLTAITSEAQAQEALRQQLATDARNKALRDALNKWSKTHDAVVADDWEAAKMPPECVEEVAPGEWRYTDRLEPREGVTTQDAVKQLSAAGMSNVDSLVIPASFDGKKTLKALGEYEEVEDPFGDGVEDPVAKVLRDLFEFPRWNGSERFAIRKVKHEAEEEAA